MAGKRLNGDEWARTGAGIAGQSNEEIATAIRRHPSHSVARHRSGRWPLRVSGLGGATDRRPPGPSPASKHADLGRMLRVSVLARLEERWSPHAISAGLRRPQMAVGVAETICAAASANAGRSELPAGTWLRERR